MSASSWAGGGAVPRLDRNHRLRIVVLGYIVRGPLGGLVWHHLQYVMGLAALGHEIAFVEDSDDYASCYDPSRDVVGTDPTYGLAFTQRAFKQVGLDDHWAYYDAHAQCWHGPLADRIVARCTAADLLLNLSGVNPIRPWIAEIPHRALIDTDPVFTQIRHLTDPVARAEALRHTTFFSFGENIGRNGATIPLDSLPWKATRQPIVLSAWLAQPGPRDGRFTTVMQWDSYRPRIYEGRRYGMKSDSFDPYLDLPAHVGRIFELALGSASAPRARLRAHGWILRNPRGPTRTPGAYQHYIQRSKAEFSVAKHGYVVSGCGWFSERSAAYLASGRPVVTQDTGFSRWLPADRGLLAFSTLEEVIAGVEEVTARYDHHCRAAREIAEAYFDARQVLPRLIEEAMAGARNNPPQGSSA